MHNTPRDIPARVAKPLIALRRWLRIQVDLWYSFPVRLLIHNFKKNQLVLFLWLILWGIVNGHVASMIGLPNLYLEPEYLNRVDFVSCALVGAAWGIFIASFHIICFILDAPQFSFCGLVRRPFMVFALNNSVIPLIITLHYLYNFWDNQLSYEENTRAEIIERCAGLLVGIIGASVPLYAYFVSTGQDIFKLLAGRVNKRLQRTRVVRVNLQKRLADTQLSTRVDYYLDHRLRWQQVSSIDVDIDRATILRVFDRNHLNAVIIQLGLLASILLLGSLRDYPAFQLPAGASLILLFTILLMIAGAFSYWLRGWAVSAFLLTFMLLNLLVGEGFITSKYEAYGLDYNTSPKAEYSLPRVKALSNDSLYRHDRAFTIAALENWKRKVSRDAPPNTKPKMVFLCVSGGGIRAAAWAMRTLQYVDSTMQGKLMRHTMLITGASGGLVGASYFRELYLRQELFRQGDSPDFINPYEAHYWDDIAKDNLNAVAFSLVVNDIFFGFQTFEYKGKRYYKDRGYALEEQLNRNTKGVLDKALCEYREPELFSYIPMMILAPTIVNDGRKLFISAMPISYMTTPKIELPRFLNQKTKGIEFSRFFEEQGAGNLRYLSALRMNATFPYVTPNVELPSAPAMEIMDAGLSDNFGVSDAVRFLYVFKDWIAANCSGVVFVSIRDTQKDKPIERSVGNSLLQRIFTPFTGFIVNQEYLQDIINDNFIEFAQSWFQRPFGVHRIEFQYVPIAQSLKELQKKEIPSDSTTNPYKIIRIERAALSWRLTRKEKQSIRRTILEPRNQSALRQLQRLLK